MGSGDLITGDNPTPYWSNETNDPCYIWAHTGAGLGYQAYAAPTVRAGQHYIVNVPRPGYTPLVFPHPLVTTNNVNPPVTPTNTWTGILTH